MPMTRGGMDKKVERLPVKDLLQFPLAQSVDVPQQLLVAPVRSPRLRPFSVDAPGHVEFAAINVSIQGGPLARRRFGRSRVCAGRRFHEP